MTPAAWAVAGVVVAIIIAFIFVAVEYFWPGAGQ